ncbi:pseudouridine synthase [uncultured Albimonas sp.]|uniref:pseudouridine synthase n=1 Tax=uncultured Albimonas sp. TaxID=1331701 RepID=UPI0030EEB702
MGKGGAAKARGGATAPDTPTGPRTERLARRLARAGVASRRMAEEIILAGRVRVNGKPVDTPALNVDPSDLVELDGAPIADAEPPRMWRYYKPIGLVTSESDEKGRPTVFQRLPAELPRVLSVGRLDLNSEGLLLLTNDGDLKRRLELPSTGWLRKYRVRVHGAPDDKALEPLRRGVEVEGERFQPMTVSVDRQQGANAWLTVSLREGRNREVRRALSSVGFDVSRLIRVSYGPFLLGDLEPGQVEEIRPKVLRDQLGLPAAEVERPAPRAAKPADDGAGPAKAARGAAGAGPARGPKGAGAAARGAKPAPRRAEASAGRKPVGPKLASSSSDSPGGRKFASRSAEAPGGRSFASRATEGTPGRKPAPRDSAAPGGRGSRSETPRGDGPRSDGPRSGAGGGGPRSGPRGEGPGSGARGEGPGSGARGQGPGSGARGQGPGSGARNQGPGSGARNQGPASGPRGSASRSGPKGDGPGSGPRGDGPSGGRGPRGGAPAGRGPKPRRG